MSGSVEPSTLSLLILLAKRFKEVGTKYKKELAVSQLFAWIAQLPPAIIPTEWYASLRCVAERRLYPLKLPIAHVDSMIPPFTEMPWTKSVKLAGVKPPMPECWGHRGASSLYPENTIASFDRAIRDGSEGLESDVHITLDDVIIMFHDPSLERTTNGKGFISQQNWTNGIEHIRTKREPHQQIPTFEQVCDLLMRPENRHVKLNIDIKADNNPERLFRLMKRTVEKYESYATALSPRLILGLWHPVFLAAALEHVPTLRRIHIGGSPTAARTYFWKHCDGFSMWFPSLVGHEGQNFIQQARNEGKDVFVWTVNRSDEMIEATRWGVKAILTDKTALFQNVRKEMVEDYVTTRSEQVGFFFRWATWRYYMLPQFFIQSIWTSELEKRAGITFKSAWKAGSEALQQAAVSGQDLSTTEVVQPQADREAEDNGSASTVTASPLLSEKALGASSISPQPAIVSASA